MAPIDPFILKHLADLQPALYWLDADPLEPDSHSALIGEITTDLCIVGAGYTGLWSALLAKEKNPNREVVIIEQRETGAGASGRNGGFCNASLTHGFVNGYTRFPDEMATIDKLGRENLDAIDRGLQPAAVGGVPAPRPNIGLATIDGEMAPSAFGEVSEMRLSREELLKNSGLAEEQLVELEGYGLIAPRGRHYDGDALAIAKAVTEMGGFGIEARHLRSFKSAADREIGLIEQVITPLTRQKSAESKARAEEVQKEIASLSIRLHAALVRGGLNRLR